MLMIAVMYPSGGDEKFDHAYYMQTHMPLVHSKWDSLGLKSSQVLRGVPGPDGAPPAYLVTALLTFDSMDNFKAAAGQHGQEIFADIPNFTNITPAMLFNETAS